MVVRIVFGFGTYLDRWMICNPSSIARVASRSFPKHCAAFMTSYDVFLPIEDVKGRSYGVLEVRKAGVAHKLLFSRPKSPFSLVGVSVFDVLDSSAAFRRFV